MSGALGAWETVIGLECHVQLATHSKVFSSASAAFGGAPNSHVDPYTLGMPGTLPVLNRAALACAIKLGLAVGSTIASTSRFARKHYFYPDLPKGFQISQYEDPICAGGTIEFLLDGEARRVGLTRIHMEEDAGKSSHVDGTAVSHVDYNRAGVALVEVVSEPALRSAVEAGAYLRALRQLVRYLGISDGNMEEGSLRCDANVSVRRRGDAKLGTRTELKNINSFRFVEAAIVYEAARQIDLLERGQRIEQETRLWNSERGVTLSMRSKEHAHDYRYFPEPDLPPITVDPAWQTELAGDLPELPMARYRRYTTDLGLSAYDAQLLTAEPQQAEFFDAVVATGADAKQAANWIGTELLGRLHRESKTLAESPVDAVRLGELLALLAERVISGKIAKDVFDRMWTNPAPPRQIVEAEGLVQVTDEGAIEVTVRAVLAANPRQAADYRAGKVHLLGYFVGQVMKQSGGKANPEIVNTILKRLLAE